MNPVEQTILSPPCGNCHAACIASILELPLAKVPSLYEGADKPGWSKDRTWGRQRRFFRSMGLELLWFDRDQNPREEGWPGFTPGGFWIATHERGKGHIAHSTVWKGSTLVWDPYPGGLPVDDRGDLVTMEWFECLDPALLVRNLAGRWRRL